MSDKTGINWTDATWNPVTGCSRVSDGCRHCYAEALSLRYGWSAKPWTHANAAENVVLHPERLDVPLHWRKPRMVFVNSMSDLFHEQVPDEFINQVWMTMRQAKQHTYQILTKRPERLLAWTQRKANATGWPVAEIWPSWVWLGVSVENQRAADERVPLLLQTPAKVRFLSCEPLLGPVDLDAYLAQTLPVTDDLLDAPDGAVVNGMKRVGDAWERRHGRIHWVIVGGESGPHYRPMNLDWARDLRDQCYEAGVAFFFKQIGGLTPKSGGRLLDGRTWDEMPQSSRSEVRI